MRPLRTSTDPLSITRPSPTKMRAFLIRKRVAALQLAPQHPVLHRLLAGAELVDAEGQERHHHAGDPQLRRAFQLLVFLPAEQPHRDEDREAERQQQRRRRLPVGRERLVLRDDALHAADQIRGRHELRDRLRPARQQRRRDRRAAQEHHRHVEQLHQHVALGHRVRDRGDDQADAAEGQRADGQEKQSATAGDPESACRRVRAPGRASAGSPG